MIAAFLYNAIVTLALMAACVALYRELRMVRAQMAAEHAAEIERLHEFYRTGLTQVGNTVAYGTPTPPPASVETEPTAEQELGRAIQEDMIARGIESLRREYEAAGIRITDEELRDEVLAIVLGQPIPEPASVKGLIS